MNLSIKIGLAIAGTIIGAGFATGKELLIFFNGNSPFYTILLIFSIFIMGLTTCLYFDEIKSSKENKIIKWILIAFSGGSYTIMLACGGQTLFDTIHIDYRLGVIITFLITVIIIKFGIDGIYKFNLFATPVIIISLVIISFFGIAGEVFLNSQSPLVNSLLYSGYNVLGVLPFMAAISKTTKKDDGIYGIVLGFIIVLATSVMLKLLLNSYFDVVKYADIPILKIIDIINPYLTYVYSVVLYSSVLTTAVSSLYVLTKSKNILLISLPLVFLAFLGFSTLLEKVYTYFGYIGIIIILTIILISMFKREKK